MEMLFCPALGKVWWSAPPAQKAIYYTHLATHMETCCLDVVHLHGHTQKGSSKCTREDRGAIVVYRNAASALWDQIKEHERVSGKQGGRRGAIAGHPMSVSPVAWRGLGMTLCMHCHLWTHGHSGEVKAGTPHPLWRGCMCKKYEESAWTHFTTFGHKQ